LNKVKDGKLVVDQAIVGSCAGGLFENITDVADILSGKDIGVGGFNLSVYTASQPIYLELLKNGSLQKLIEAGAIIKPSICGPCFGAGDIPANGELSVRNTTRNFSNREGSISSQGQLSSVALMDARSIAATAVNGGVLTAATQIDVKYSKPKYYFNSSIYKKRVYDGINKPIGNTEISFGPNIKDWPEFYELNQALILKVISVFEEDVITTDDLLPSDASNFRSNPERLAEHTLSMKDPTYVSSAKEVRQMEINRRQGVISDEIMLVLEKAQKHFENLKTLDLKNVSIGSTIYANKLGDGSSREQSASNQKVLGAWSNIAREYATKRYASNVKNWGMLPLIAGKNLKLKVGDYIIFPKIKDEIINKSENITAYLVNEDVKKIELKLLSSTKKEIEIIAAGGLLNYYKLSSE
jgi:aconitate hydratase